MKVQEINRQKCVAWKTELAFRVFFFRQVFAMERNGPPKKTMNAHHFTRSNTCHAMKLVIFRRLRKYLPAPEKVHTGQNSKKICPHVRNSPHLKEVMKNFKCKKYVFLTINN